MFLQFDPGHSPPKLQPAQDELLYWFHVWNQMLLPRRARAAKLGKPAMKFLPLLGKLLKDDEVVAVLEQADMEVIYDFDRLHENTPDKYWAESKKHGYQLRFDADQILDAVFLYAAPIDGFTPVTAENCDVLFFATTNDAEVYGAEHQLHTTKGGADFFGIWQDWIRLEYENYSVHYQFQDGGLTLVTLTKKE